MDQVNIYFPTTGQVTYRLRDAIGDGERIIYYSYNPDDDHEAIIEKTAKDMTMLTAAFLKVRNLHGFTYMGLTYDEDNTSEIEEYLECYSYAYEDEEEDEHRELP